MTPCDPIWVLGSASVRPRTEDRIIQIIHISTVETIESGKDRINSLQLPSAGGRAVNSLRAQRRNRKHASSGQSRCLDRDKHYFRAETMAIHFNELFAASFEAVGTWEHRCLRMASARFGKGAQ